MKLAVAISLLLNALLVAGLMLYHPTEPVAPTIAFEPLAVVRHDAPVRVFAPAPRTDTPVKYEPVESLVDAWNGPTEELIAHLKVTGMTRDQILAVLIALDMKRLKPSLMSIRFPRGLTRWAVMNHGSTGMSRLSEVYAEARADMARKWGPEFHQAMFENDQVRALKWGELDNENLAAVTGVWEKYGQLKAMVLDELDRDSITSIGDLNAVFEKDIRAVLDPARAEDFLAYNSPTALSLQGDLAKAKIALDEDTYRTLLQARNELHDTYRDAINRGENNPSSWLLWDAQLYVSILGPEKGLQLSLARNPAAREIDSLLAAAGQDLMTRVNLHTGYNEAAAQAEAIQQANLDNLAEVRPQIAALHARYYNELAARIPAPQLNAFIETPRGRFLKIWRGRRDGP